MVPASFRIMGMFWLTVAPAGTARCADVDRAEHAVWHLVCCMVVGVVHADRRSVGDELVVERFAGLDRRLGDVGHAVHGVREVREAMEVQHGRFRQVVR